MMSLFDILFDIIAAAGPFLVFAGMGEGKDSGKLLFKTFKSSDSSVEFTEDSTGLTFSSQGGNSIPINSNQIAFGTGTGITSSNNPNSNCNFKVDGRTGYESITGVKFIGVDWARHYSRPFSRNHLLIGGSCTEAGKDGGDEWKGYNNVVIGGYKNCLMGLRHSGAQIGRGADNVMIVGQNNCLRLSTSSAIIGGQTNSFTRTDYFGEPGNGVNPGYFYTLQSSIIGSSNIKQKKGAIQSTILSSYCADYSNTTTIYDMYRTSIISSCKFSGFNAKSRMTNSTIVSSGEAIGGSTYTSLVSTRNSSITGTPSGLLPAFNNSIISSNISSISLSRESMIISSTNSSISSKPGGFFQVKNNSIISGSNNYIEFCYTLSGSGNVSIKNSSIISGSCNSINVIPFGVISRRSACNSSIISGYKNEISNTLNSLIISSSCNKMCLENNSVIMSGFKNYISGTISSFGNVIVSGSLNKMCFDTRNTIFISTIGAHSCCGNSNVIISASSSCIRTRKDLNDPLTGAESNIIISDSSSCIMRNDTNFGGMRSSIISGLGNAARYTYDSSIIAGRYNTLRCSNSSSILGGQCNLICFNRTGPNEIDSRTIIAGYKNCLCFKPKITTIIGGRNNSIVDDVANAAVVGGENICNKYQNTTMVPTLCIGGKTWMNGFTGSNGLWILPSIDPSFGAICVCCGLIISGPVP